MPAKSTTTTKTTKGDTSKLNPTIAPAWRNDKFGFGAILSKAITEEGLDTVMKNLQVGSKILVKKSKTKAPSGDDQYFVEILPPYNPEGKTAPAGTPGNSELD